MNALSWNCRGICNASTVRASKAQIRGILPDFVVLCEMKASDKRMKEVMNSLGFSYRQVIEAKGFAGGLCMMWRANDLVEGLEYNKNMIAIQVSDKLSKWVLVGFYGPTYPAKNSKAWGNLSALLESFSCPWICIDDFNCTLSQDERFGGSRGSSSAVNHLKDLMFEFSAIDLGSSSNKFTGEKENGGEPL
ncbi:hypothetical protein ACB092_09G145100 [Castanea dentata]